MAEFDYSGWLGKNSGDTRKAIQDCIRRKEFEWSEAFFLNVLKSPRNKMEPYWSVIALRDCGGSQSIEALKQECFSRKEDTQACAVLTLARISGAKESAFYGSLLNDKKFRMKSYAAIAVYLVADESAIDAVFQFLDRTLPRCVRDLNLGDSIILFKYLEKYIDGVPGIFDYLSKKRRILMKLNNSEKNILSSNAPAIAQFVFGKPMRGKNHSCNSLYARYEFVHTSTDRRRCASR